jgi:heat shock protein HtpX
MDNLFSTHPSTENRIAALDALARELGDSSRTRHAPQPAGGSWSNAGGSRGPWG